MKKFIILILGLSLTAQSCDLTGGLFDFGSGTRGVFKSEDAGQTFSAVNRQVRGDIDSISVNALAFDSSNPDIIYLASSNGIFKTEDGAKTWRYILAGIAVADIMIDPFSPRTVYASGIVGQNGKIIKTVDAGGAWVDIYTEPSKNNTVLSIAQSTSNSSTILAGLNTGELLRSTDEGRTWQTVFDFSDRVIDIQFSNGGAYALTARTGLYKSPDSGVTWNGISSSLTFDTLSSPNRSVSSVSAFYSLALDPRQAGVIYLGAEEGLFRSVNDGANWSFMSLPVRNGGLRVSGVAVDPINSNNVLVSVVSTIYKSTNGGLTWETKVLPTSATIHTILINPQSTNIIYLGLRS